MVCERSPSLLSVKDLTFFYGKKEVLKGASLALEPGLVYGLLGPNGSGKSTLMRCCLGFLSPLTGSVLLKGEDVRTVSPSFLAKSIAYIPQEENCPFPFTVRELVSMGRTPHMGYRPYLNQHDKKRVQEALEQLELTALAEKNWKQLSGGEKQLALIARALVQDTPLVLMDEPTSALDFYNQVMVWQTLKTVAQGGVTLLVCCHDPNHILWFCDQMLLMSQGRIVASDEPHVLCDKGALQELYGDSCLVGTIDGVRMVYPRPNSGMLKHSRDAR